MARPTPDPLDDFHPAVRTWFRACFRAPTPPQALGWPAIQRGDNTLLLAPTGTGKTLAAFMACIDKLLFSPVPQKQGRCRVLYVSPLKALAVDVERNLRSPLVGIANVAAARGDAHNVPRVAVRTGDTAAAERARFNREPADVLITTPESLYLMLTSNARDALRTVETVIIDEIHALVPTKRGAHLALSLERLEHLVEKPFQRIGLSATQRPLEEIAHFLGGGLPAVKAKRRGKKPLDSARGERSAGPLDSARGERAAGPLDSARGEPVAEPLPVELEAEVSEEFESADAPPEFRPVTIIDAGKRKALDLRIEVPVEDMAKLGQPVEIPSGPASQGPVRASIWTAIHPRLLELVQAHTSTLIFVNSRRIAERLAAALNELAGEVLVLAHHGSIARAQRMEIEDRLKAGKVRGLVATSSLELGIDMGAVDLVVQIEAPPSVASGMQRIGRAGHQIDTPSRGVIFPKYRADLVACAAITRSMRDGHVEATRYPRNPLDVLAQQIVAMVAMDPWTVEDLFATLRRAAPYAGLSRGAFEGVLDLLAGRYVTDELAELRPRVTWDRVAGTLAPREGAKRVAVISGGTIPDRGLYGVFLAGAERQKARVGELDEEMVFESRVGETFLLGASTWRIEEITHDKVLVSPAPGEPGKMPFWRGDTATRPLELGQSIGKLMRSLRDLPRPAAVDLLVREHDMDSLAAQNLLQYLDDQHRATDAVPDDQTLVVERVRDELGDWRVCVLSPLGGKIHAPWSMAVIAKIKDETGLDVETLWTNDGFVVRFPESESPPDVSLVLPSVDEVERLVLRQLGASALFAARFRENAGRALLLPRRMPGVRTPLWHQRKRAADLLAVAARYPSFPMLLETYRECLRDVFDMPSLIATLGAIQARRIKVVTADSKTPSPFAGSLLFGFVANYIYDGDAPLAERRAQALAIDQAQLKELLGDAELRELLDVDALADVAAQLQRLDVRFAARNMDALHDLFLRIGDLTRAEVRARCVSEEVAASLDVLVQARRVIPVRVAGEERFIAVEDASRYRDTLGVPLPMGLPEAMLKPVPHALQDLVLRYARTHAPFTAGELGARLGLALGPVETILGRLMKEGRLLEGAFRPGGTQREFCDPDVLGTIRRRSLAKLRHEVEPVEPRVLGRLMSTWQGLGRKGRGLDALLDTVERLQGAALPASILEREILPARVEGYTPADLDALMSAGEVTWVGVEPLGDRDGRVALYLTDSLPKLHRPPPLTDAQALTEREQKILAHLEASGASFFAPLHAALGGGFPTPTVDALWDLVWKGLVTNDTFRAVRSFIQPKAARRGRIAASGRVFRSRRAGPASTEGRWSLVSARSSAKVTDTEWSAALAQQLLTRYGIVTREMAQLESIPGGFSAVYTVLRTLEEAGRIRRGYFVSGVGAMQFAMPAVLDLLRSLRLEPEPAEVLTLSATDPANPYGAILPWPSFGLDENTSHRGASRSVGAQVILYNGGLAAYVSRGGRQAFVNLPEEEPDRSRVASAVAARLAELSLGEGRDGMLLEELNGQPASESPLAPFLGEAGFVPSSLGYHLRRSRAYAMEVVVAPLRPPPDADA